MEKIVEIIKGEVLKGNINSMDSAKIEGFKLGFEAQQKEIERLKEELYYSKKYNAHLVIRNSEKDEKNNQLKKQVEELSNVLIDIDNTLFHHNYSVDGYHLNGEKEPIMNFVADFDMNVIRDKQQLNKQKMKEPKEEAERIVKLKLTKEQFISLIEVMDCSSAFMEEVEYFNEHIKSLDKMLKKNGYERRHK